jgi:hypothetical protein
MAVRVLPKNLRLPLPGQRRIEKLRRSDTKKRGEAAELEFDIYGHLFPARGRSRAVRAGELALVG